jgi:hypothetical protein
MWQSHFLSLGYGLTREKPSDFYVRSTFHTATAALRLWVFGTEYLVLKSSGVLDSKPIQILTFGLRLGPVVLTAAQRWIAFDREGEITQQHFAFHAYLSKSFALGALYN